MGKYQDINCPICNKPLENGEPIAICPDCGAPYHKSCIEKTGKCIYDDLHAEGKSWQAPKREEKYDGMVSKRCSRCGSINPGNGLFCEVCGTPLNRPENEGAQRPNMNDPRPNMGQQQGTQPPFGFPGQAPFGANPPGVNQMPYDPYNAPFGGVSPDEKIDGIPVQEWAIFVGQNTPYFIPKFKYLSDNKKVSSFNFAAMFFNCFYFLYRKMTLLGISLLILMLALQIPSLLINIDMIRINFDETAKALFTSDALINVANVFSFIRLAVMFLCGMFANKLYKSHCHDKILKLKEKYPEHTEYVTNLTKNGSVSKKLILILVGIYFVFSVCVSFLMVSQMM